MTEPQADDAAPDLSTPEGPAPAPTGVPSADGAAERLAALDNAPLDEHVEIYEDVHRRLQEGLADLDEQ